MAVFRGEVRKGGKPVSHTRVVIHAAGFVGGRIAETMTASDGRFGFELDSSYTRVHVYVDGTDKGEYRVSDFASIGG